MRVNHFFNFTYTLALSDFTTMGIYYFDNNNTIFWLHLWHAEVPGTGIEPVTQLQPQPQQLSIQAASATHTTVHPMPDP